MAKRKIEWSKGAKNDLFTILNFYIERNGATTYSIKLNNRFDKSLQLIAKYPNIGTETDYDSVRALITGDFQIIYEVFDQLILVIMLWDCRRNPDDKKIGERMK
ncbi:type II toxin-antitoxin system RelE/ParE family toxin [Draconibacterium sp.]|nr:type II toxin-antitoxin system RelE/ParE family toxin [Draconibacterium sp.]